MRKRHSLLKTLINWLEKVHMCFTSRIFRVTFLTLQCYETLKHDVAILQDFLKKDITFSSLLVYQCENEFSYMLGILQEFISMLMVQS